MHSRRNPDKRGRRARTVALTAALVALALLLWLARWPGRAREESKRRSTSADVFPTPLPEDVRRPTPTAMPVARSELPASQADPPPIIDEIVLEKSEVCSGEENLVTVRAHTTNGTNEFLHYAIDGNGGASVPLRVWLGADGRVEGRHSVTVFGRTNTVITAPVPNYKVKDCQPTRIVSVEQHLRANSWSDFDFLAKIVTLPPPSGPARPDSVREPFTPSMYDWSFGDGENATTTGPLAAHSYEARSQDTLYSYFSVGVVVHSAEGRQLAGRTTLPLLNPAFEALARKGIVVLLIALHPRFPELGDNGRVLQHVRLWHTQHEPVTIDSATATKYFETGSGETRPQSVDATHLLGTAMVPPGKDGISTTVVLDTIADPGVFSITYRLSGHSQDGYPVMGSFSVMRPPPRPTSETGQPVTDPALSAKIVAAREILGKDVVNDEDIWQLEREGRLARRPTSTDAIRSTAMSTAPPRTPPSPPNPGVPAVGPPVPTSVTAPPTATVTSDRMPSKG